MVGAAGFTLVVGAAGHDLFGARGVLGFCPCGLRYALAAYETLNNYYNNDLYFNDTL
jgi:hypothetical protein